MLMVNQLTGFGARRAGGGGGGGGSPSAAFLARTSGLDSTHITAYTDLIDGLVADGVWTKLDVLHVYATQDSATALLNLVSTSYNGVANGSPSFTADRGFTGANGGSTVYIDTQFNGNTASSPNYTLNNAHLSVWHVSSQSLDIARGTVGAGDGTNGFSPSNSPQAYVVGGTSYTFALNSEWNQALQGGSAASGAGHWLTSRNSSSNNAGYHNAASVLGGTNTNGIPNRNMYSLAANYAGGPIGVPAQIAMISIGGHLTSTDTTNFYNRLRTYMTAVGVP